MANGKTSKKFEVHLPDGLLLATFTISESENTDAPEARREEPKTEEKGNGGKKDGATMTDAQKRYLFRLLADQGFENGTALEELKKRFGVEVLTTVSKVDASREIDRLMSNQKGGVRHGH